MASFWIASILHKRTNHVAKKFTENWFESILLHFLKILQNLQFLTLMAHDKNEPVKIWNLILKV